MLTLTSIDSRDSCTTRHGHNPASKNILHKKIHTHAQAHATTQHHTRTSSFFVPDVGACSARSDRFSSSTFSAVRSILARAATSTSSSSSSLSLSSTSDGGGVGSRARLALRLRADVAALPLAVVVAAERELDGSATSATAAARLALADVALLVAVDADAVADADADAAARRVLAVVVTAGVDTAGVDATVASASVLRVARVPRFTVAMPVAAAEDADGVLVDAVAAGRPRTLLTVGVSTAEMTGGVAGVTTSTTTSTSVSTVGAGRLRGSVDLARGGRAEISTGATAGEYPDTQKKRTHSLTASITRSLNHTRTKPTARSSSTVET